MLEKSRYVACGFQANNVASSVRAIGTGAMDRVEVEPRD